MATVKEKKKTVRGNAFTDAWKSSKGKEIKKGDAVRHKDDEGRQGVVVARHTRPKDRVPMVLIELAGAATGAAKTKGKKKAGPARTSIPAAEVVHVKAKGA